MNPTDFLAFIFGSCIVYLICDWLEVKGQVDFKDCNVSVCCAPAATTFCTKK